MNNYKFLQTYVALQKGIMFDKLFDLGFATVCYCRTDSSPFWNNALVNELLNQAQISTIESKLIELTRKPALYFENRPDLTPLVDLLSSSGYSGVAEDSLMFYSDRLNDKSRFHLVKKVLSEGDLDVFIKTFDRCYRKDDPVNPYGELGAYLTAARIAWRKHHSSNHIEYFIACKGDLPVAVSTLTNFKKVGYISNVGSLRSVRGEGYGKLATLFCVSQSINNGNNVHCLATEEGTNPHSFYTAIGFHTRFTAKLFVKS